MDFQFAEGYAQYRVSLLSINQLDTAQYTSTFGRIPSVSTKSTSTRSKRKRERASSSTHITVPSIAHPTEPTTSSLHTTSPSAASTVPQCPPATEFPKPTRKPLTISESRRWLRRLAHFHPTALRSLIDGYTKDDSMYTVCIQAKHKQKIIKVKTNRTTKPFELVHSDVCGPFSRPTSASHRYYILFIDDYTRYTFVWVLPDKKSKTCISAYHTDIREKEKDSRYILA